MAVLIRAPILAKKAETRLSRYFPLGMERISANSGDDIFQTLAACSSTPLTQARQWRFRLDPDGYWAEASEHTAPLEV
ncbi:hypothetical protein WH5701_11739 [Synechococcus sp. WH 5701]|nr:hypothetical protein WH5701_11739 [Synechococcus sp. WH 5701]